jgi:hypothetical protein
MPVRVKLLSLHITIVMFLPYRALILIVYYANIGRCPMLIDYASTGLVCYQSINLYKLFFLNQ